MQEVHHVETQNCREVGRLGRIIGLEDRQETRKARVEGWAAGSLAEAMLQDPPGLHAAAVASVTDDYNFQSSHHHQLS